MRSSRRNKARRSGGIQKGRYTMTTSELLTYYLESELDKVFDYSANRQQTQAKRGYEREFSEAKERAEILQNLIEEIGKMIDYA